MAEEVGKFRERARRRGRPPINPGGTGIEVLQSFAQTTGRLADSIGIMANKMAAQEGRQAGMEAGLEASVPAAERFLPPRRPPPPVKTTRSKAGSDAQVLKSAAARLGVAPEDLATVVSYETAGSFSPSIQGGKDNNHLGLIQFGIPEREKYGVHAAQSFAEQMDSTVAFLQDRGFEPGMDILDLYSTINAGSPGRYDASDRPGDTVSTHVRRMNSGAHRDNALAFLKSGDEVVEGEIIPPPSGDTLSSAPGQAIQTAGPKLILKNDGTLRGDAFDTAATGIFVNRLDASVRQALAGIASQHEADPAGLNEAFDAFAAGQRQELPDEVRGRFEALFTREKLSYLRRAGQGFNLRLADESNAAFEVDFAERRNGMLRQARDIGNDPNGDQVVAGELASFQEFLETNTSLSETQKSRKYAQIAQELTAARIMGGFERAVTPEDQARYAEAYAKHFQDGTGLAKSLTPETDQKITARMDRVLRQAHATRTRQEKALTSELNRLKRRVEAGFDVPENERDLIRAQVEVSGSPELAKDHAFFEQMADWQGRFRLATPEEIAREVNSQESLVQTDGATPQEITMLGVMRNVQKAVTKALDSDQLGWAGQTGQVEIEGLDFSSSEGLDASLTERQADAAAVSQLYARPIRYFRPGESEALSRRMVEDAEFAKGFSAVLVNSFGSDAPAVLAEISQEAPLLAHAAGQALSTNNNRVFDETMEALRLRTIEGYDPVKASASVRASTPVGAALLELPEFEAALTAQAEALYEFRSRGSGVDAKDDPEAAAAIWQSALNDAAGAQIRDGQTFGGFGDVNGRLTLIPPSMTADQFQRRISNILDFDLETQMPILSANGVPVTAAQIRRGNMLTVGEGRYRVALGDPAGPDPQWVLSDAGRFWVLDVAKLMAVDEGLSRLSAPEFLFPGNRATPR